MGGGIEVEGEGEVRDAVASVSSSRLSAAVCAQSSWSQGFKDENEEAKITNDVAAAERTEKKSGRMFKRVDDAVDPRQVRSVKEGERPHPFTSPPLPILQRSSPPLTPLPRRTSAPPCPTRRTWPWDPTTIRAPGSSRSRILRNTRRSRTARP